MKIAIASVEFRDNVSAPGVGLESGNLALHLEATDYDLSFDPVLGCVFATPLDSIVRNTDPRPRQTRLYPTGVVASMIYVEPGPSKK